MPKGSPKHVSKMRVFIRFLLGWIGIVSLEILAYVVVALIVIIAIYFDFLEFP